jgi:hypothetical protein
MGEIVIEKVNLKAYIMALTNFLLLIVAGVVMLYGFGEHKARYWVPGLLGFFALLISFVLAIINTMQIKKLITITREGVIDNSSISGVGFISFDEIKEFIIVTVNYKKSIAIIPKNVDSFLSKLTVVKRSLARRNINANLPPIMIPADMAKDMDPEDILSLLRKRLLDYSSLDD